MAQVSSVVILPDPESLPPPSKRRQSSVSDSTTKRPRLSSKDRSPDSAAGPCESTQPIDGTQDASSDRRRGSIQDRRKSSAVEEKKRGQRLFGGLLSTLSQSTPNGQQKRRAEVEKRQQEKAKQQKATDEKLRKEKLASLQKIRKAEQIKFDEKSMRIRHANMLAQANFLFTKTEPKLFFKPWELLPEQEQRIKIQIAEAKSTIEREEAEFRARYPSNDDNDRLVKTVKDTNTTSKETVGEPKAESPSVSVVDSTNSLTQAPSDQAKAENLAQEEHNGEVVVENEEDTVIY